MRAVPRLDDLTNLRLVHVTTQPRSRSSELWLKRRKAGETRLSLPKHAHEVLRHTTHVEVLTNGPYVVVRSASERDPHARRLGKGGDITVRELGELYGLAREEQARLPFTVDQGVIIAEVPEELIARASTPRDKEHAA